MRGRDALLHRIPQPGEDLGGVLDVARLHGSVAPKTVRNTHIVLHRALAEAERLRLVMRNVAHLARPPAVPHVERATWTADELRSFLEHVTGDRLFSA
ncbi:MAG TPA: hypothetical protein PLS63_12965 [Microthrixaceae bacterium]|nr:hypothetical protein [Microthrixaceae bacterium]